MKKAMIAITAFLLAVTLSGCGKTDDSLEQYKTDMTAFTDKINELATSIDNIDVDSDTRTEELLGYLDEMDAAFIEMGSLEVPDHEQFANIEELADEASANLSKSVALYHQAFDNAENYDPQLVDAALEYYSRAFKRLGYIGTILQGELPQDETITIISEGDEVDVIPEQEDEMTEAFEESDQNEEDNAIQETSDNNGQ